jgi:uncharacterized protein YaaR (DUF327 family)
MIEEIDKKIKILLEFRDSEDVKKSKELRGWLCDTISHSYSLESAILFNNKLKYSDSQFFKAQSAVSRHYVDWGLNEVADIYNELRIIALKYMDKKDGGESDL